MWGIGYVQRLVAHRLPRTGIRIAKFGRGRTISCDLSVGYDRSVYLGREEVTELRLLARLLRRGDVFVDCGANIGLYTVFGAELVGPDGCVFAIEAVPSTFARLRHNVGLSDIDDRVRLVNRALSSVAGRPAVLSGDKHNIMRIADEPHGEVVTTTTATLDGILAATPTVAGMKIDVEGHELSVLQGGEAMISRCLPWMIIEFNRDLVGTSELGRWDVHAFLTERGYQAHLPAGLLASDRTPLEASWTTRRAYTNLLYRSTLSVDSLVRERW